MRMLAGVPQSSASFAEVKVLAMLNRPLRATGRLVYRRPAHLEKITLEPQPESLVVDGDRLTLTEAPSRRASSTWTANRRSAPWWTPSAARCRVISRRCAAPTR